MKIMKISVEPEIFLSLSGCSVEKAPNRHFTASLSGYVSEEEEKKILRHGIEEISILGILEDASQVVLFKGMIADANVQYRGQTRFLTIHAVSYTVLLDQKRRKRVFQGQNQTYRQIVDEVLKHAVHTGMIYMGERQKKTDGLVVQYQESDWEFLRRLAAKQGMPLVADCQNNYPCFYFGIPERIRYHELSCRNIRMRQTGTAGDTPHAECLVHSRDYLEICDLVALNERKWRVMGVFLEQQQGEIIIRYQLEEERYVPVDLPGHNPAIKGLSLTATVKAVEDARVRLKIHCEQDPDWGDGLWYDYATVYTEPDGTGWYCMPEVGEQVRLYFPDWYEKHAYVVSHVHREGNGTRLDTDRKSFRTRYGKELYFTPEEIVITNNNGLSVSLHDKEGISIQSSQGIFIRSDSMVDIQSGEEIRIQGNEGVSIQQNQNILMIRDGIYEKGRNIEHL